MDGYWYLATPYSRHPGGIEEAFRAAAREAALYVRAGVPVFCPIAHTHPIAVHGEIDPYDHAVWMPADAPFMRGARGLVVCMMESWELSHGIREEIREFVAAGKPVIYAEPGTVPLAEIRAAGEIVAEAA